VGEKDGRNSSPGSLALFDCELRGGKSKLVVLTQKELILSARRVSQLIALTALARFLKL